MSTAIAQPNIALIKYWGKVDEDLIIPATDSISVTLDGFPTTTTVTLTDGPTDTAELNGTELHADELGRIIQVLDRVRHLSGMTARAHVRSVNTIPTAAGLASSAAGFAALAMAALDAYGLDTDRRDVSRLARLGSGSASRSAYGGLVHWQRGSDDRSSYAVPLEWRGDPLALVIAQLSAARKKVSSRSGMTRTIETSPFYPGWVTSNQELVHRALDAIESSDLGTLGELTELSTMRMHASMLGAEPPLRYLTAESFAVIDEVQRIREEGLTAYSTADAGPNVKILTRLSDVQTITDRLTEEFPHIRFLSSGIGQGAHLVAGAEVA